MNKETQKAKEALDLLIKKSRVHLYKPIQIGEILYHSRVCKDLNLNDLESYRNASKHWRDEVSKSLLGRVCTSSARFQDDLFNSNAMPPSIIKILAKENERTNGAVEAYIYNRFSNKHSQLSEALETCNGATKETFNVKDFIDSFWSEPGLKRSIDKVYEIVVYALFSTLVETLNMQVEISVNPSKKSILNDFKNFAKMVMGIEVNKLSKKQDAKVYRVGVTNAADRGLDMYSNWDPAIQIKHLSLDIELAKSIVTSISSDRIIIVCKDAEKAVIVSLLTQIGWKSRIQSVVTEKDLANWYETALRGRNANIIGDKLLDKMKEELSKEFPSIKRVPSILKNRHYDKIKNSDWV